MIEELDDKYLVLKRSDIKEYIDNANQRKLEIMVDKLNKQRHKQGSKVNKKYVVVSEDMKCYDFVESLVIDEINNIDHLAKMLDEWENKIRLQIAQEEQASAKTVVPKKKATVKKVAPKKKVTTNVENKD